MQGKLYLCATPIGNLEDITLRVLRTLQEVDLIAAEDTRNSIKLLNHFDIKTPMTSYHEFNKIEKAHQLVEKMQSGTNIALITDAGTPGISDPGEELVKIAYEAGIEVTSLPGAAACITALTLSGLSTRRFAFEAFLPKDKKERKRVLEELKDETRTIIIYEAPHHLIKTLEELEKELDNRKITLCRELTKVHEEVWRTTLGEAAAHYREKEPRGEFVLVIEGRERPTVQEEEYTLEEAAALAKELAAGGLSASEAAKQAAQQTQDAQRNSCFCQSALLTGQGFGQGGGIAFHNGLHHLKLCRRQLLRSAGGRITGARFIGMWAAGAHGARMLVAGRIPIGNGFSNRCRSRFLHTQQPPDGYTEQAAQSHQLFDLRQSGVGFPFINRLAGDAQPVAQGLLGQAQFLSLLRNPLSCCHAQPSFF